MTTLTRRAHGVCSNARLQVCCDQRHMAVPLRRVWVHDHTCSGSSDHGEQLEVGITTDTRNRSTSIRLESGNALAGLAATLDRDNRRRYSSAVLASDSGYPQPCKRHQRSNLPTVGTTSSKRRAESTREACLMCRKRLSALSRAAGDIHETTYPTKPFPPKALVEQDLLGHVRDTRGWEVLANHSWTVHSGGFAIQVRPMVGHCPEGPSGRCKIEPLTKETCGVSATRDTQSSMDGKQRYTPVPSIPKSRSHDCQQPEHFGRQHDCCSWLPPPERTPGTRPRLAYALSISMYQSLVTTVCLKRPSFQTRRC